jgi:branched-subunit amino acid transport protein AzlD
MTAYLIGAVLAMGMVTFGLRSLPFLLPGHWQDHRIMRRIRTQLPPAIMLILVIFSLSRIPWGDWPHGLPETLAVACVAALHLTFRSMIISVVAGTAFYLVLRQAF